MAVAIWKPGRRLFSLAAILMVLMAAAHTIGFLSGGPSTPVEEKLFADMGALQNPLGLGMSPSVKDIYFALAFTLSMTFAGLALMNLVLAAIPETPDRVLQGAAWVNALWVAASLIGLRRYDESHL